jgi:hypothetical protein
LVNPKRLDKSIIKEYFVFVMNTVKAYEEVVDVIAAGTTPQDVIAFRPSEAAQERVEALLSREKDGDLSPAEKSRCCRVSDALNANKCVVYRREGASNNSS